MTTRLGAWCEGVVEAGCLTALVAVPLLMNVDSASTFELDKVALLRVIGAVVAAAAAIAWLERRAAGGCKPRAARGPSRLWLPLLLAYVAVLTIATVMSVAPRVSLWGSLTRMQGLYTTLAYVALHLSLVAVGCSREQLERLVTCSVVAGIPVALYAVLQHAGADPLLWVADSSGRTASTLGNPIFAGAFLVMVVPLTLYRLVEAFGDALRDEASDTRAAVAAGGALNVVLHAGGWLVGLATGTISAWLTVCVWTGAGALLQGPRLAFFRVAVYGTALAVQLSALVVTQSRGPALGLLAASLVASLGWAAMRGRFRLAAALCGTAMIVAGTVLFLSVPPASNAASGDDADVIERGRFAQLFEGTGRVRLLIWDGVSRLMASSRVRTVIGYGPETLQFVIPPHVAAELGHIEQRGALPDRAHNETLDMWASAGLAGAALYLAMMTAVFTFGLRAAGLMRRRSDDRTFLLVHASCGAAGALASFALVGSWRAAAATLPLGLAAGLCVFLVICARAAHDDAGTNRSPVANPALGLAMLAAIVAHFVEGQFGIGVTATHLYFWTLAAALVLGAREPDAASPSVGMSEEAVRERTPGPALAAGGLAVGVAATVLVFDFVRGGADLVEGAVLWLLVTGLSLCGAIALVESIRAADARVPRRVTALALAGGLPLAVAFSFAMIQLWWINAAPGRASLSLLLYAAVLAAIFLASRFLRYAGIHSPRPATRWAWLAPGVAAGVALLVADTAARPVQANVHYRDALRAFNDAPARAVSGLRRSLAIQPRESAYHAAMAEVLAVQALGSTGLAESAALFERAAGSLATARALQPLNLEHRAYEARLYVRWGARDPDAAAQRARWNSAIATYRDALSVTPNNVVLWNELGAAEFLMGRSDAALATFSHSLRLDDRFPETHLLLASVYRQRGDAPAATRAWQRATNLVPPERLPLLRGLVEHLLRFDTPRDSAGVAARGTVLAPH